MAVIIDTVHKVPDMFGADVHGFTSGNTTGGILATEVSAQWFNKCQQEINNAILAGYDTTITGFLNPFDDEQLKNAFGQHVSDQYPRGSLTTWNPGIYRQRSTDNYAGQTYGHQNGFYRFQEYRHELLSGSTTNIAGISVPNTPGPDGQIMVEWFVSLVQSDLNANYGNAIWRASAGATGLQHSSASYSDPGNLLNLVFSVIAVGLTVYLRVAIPAVPAGKKFNVNVFAQATKVYPST